MLRSTTARTTPPPSPPPGALAAADAAHADAPEQGKRTPSPAGDAAGVSGGAAASALQLSPPPALRPTVTMADPRDPASLAVVSKRPGADALERVFTDSTPEADRLVASLLAGSAGACVPPAMAGWIQEHEVHVDRLLAIDGVKTAYGVLNIGGHVFIVGPTPQENEKEVMQKLVEAFPRIGAIFTVDPVASAVLPDAGGAGRADCGASGYFKPRRGYVRPVARGEGEAAAAKPPVQAVHHQTFHGFPQYAHIDPVAAWMAGRGIAQVLQRQGGNNQTIAVICSESGISRVCVAAVYAVLQLKNDVVAQFTGAEDPAWKAAINGLIRSLALEQRSPYSANHLGKPSDLKTLSVNREFASAVDAIRRPGSWNHEIGDIIPQLAAQAGLTEGRALAIQDASGLVVHRYTRDGEEQHGARAREVSTPDDVFVYRLDTGGNGERHMPHYEVGDPHGAPWEPMDAGGVDADGDCFFRAVARAVHGHVGSRTGEDLHIQANRERMADYAAEHIGLIAPFFTRPPAVEWTTPGFGDLKLSSIKFAEPYAVPLMHKHQEAILFTDVSPRDPDVKRLVTASTTGAGRYECDNHYYADSSIVGLYRAENALQFSTFPHPTVRQPVLASIDHQGRIVPIELSLGAAAYAIRIAGHPARVPERIQTLPILPAICGRIALVTDETGTVRGGPGAGYRLSETRNGVDLVLRHAVVFQALRDPASNALRCLVCHDGDHPNERVLKFIPPPALDGKVDMTSPGATYILEPRDETGRQMAARFAPSTAPLSGDDSGPNQARDSAQYAGSGARPKQPLTGTLAAPAAIPAPAGRSASRTDASHLPPIARWARRNVDERVARLRERMTFRLSSGHRPPVGAPRTTQAQSSASVSVSASVSADAANRAARSRPTREATRRGVESGDVELQPLAQAVSYAADSSGDEGADAPDTSRH